METNSTFLYPELSKEQVELIKTLVLGYVSSLDTLLETSKFNFLANAIKKRVELLSEIILRLNLELENYEKNK